MPLALSPIYKAASSELRQFMMQASRRYGGTMLRDWMTTLAESLGRPSAQPSG